VSSRAREADRNIDRGRTFPERCRDVDGDTSPELRQWIDAFNNDHREAALSFWHETHKGIQDSSATLTEDVNLPLGSAADKEHRCARTS
jgi:hypothetical protein